MVTSAEEKRADTMEQVNNLPPETHWQSRTKAALEDDLLARQRELASEVLRLSPPGAPADVRLDNWSAQNRTAVDRCVQIFNELKAHPAMELAMLSVALREVDNLVYSSAALHT